MKSCRTIVILLVLATATLQAAPSDETQTDAPQSRDPVNRVRFFPEAGREKAMLGGKFAGSNVSERTGYEVFGEITAVPEAGKWTELTFPVKKYYRWVRYEAPPGSYGNVAEVEFYAGDQKVGFGTFGSLGHRNFHPYGFAMDGKTESYFDSDTADGQYVGTDVGYWCDDPPNVMPKSAESKDPVTVTMTSSSPHAVIRYSFEGTPGPNEGQVYTGPITIDHTATIFAVAYRQGFARSPTSTATYVVGNPAKPGFSTLFVGNSLTGSTFPLARYAFATGWDQSYRSFVMGGAPSESIWKKFVEDPAKPLTGTVYTKRGGDVTQLQATWDATLAALTKVDQFCVEVNSVNVATEATYQIKFFDAVRAKFPDMQPWLYGMWPEMHKAPREVTLGKVPSLQLKTVYPAETWEENCAAWNLYDEDVKTEVLKTYTGEKKPRLLPCAIAAGCLKSWLDQGKIPGMTGELYPFMMFRDNFHSGPLGTYLISMLAYATFYGESPVGKIPPIDTDLTPEQAAAFQALAWDVAKNYPDCGLYEEGTTPVGTPRLLASPAKSGDAKDAGLRHVTLSSSTEGAWFRYTLDGTEPTRTRGYIYCGVVSMRPGMTLKAIAYKSGMADSGVAQGRY